jgi:hypothetical protein
MLRNSNREKKRDARRHQRCDFDARMGGIGGVECPGELGPSPPDEPEHEHHLAHCAPRDAVVEQAHDLRNAENEHEVEKELDERDFLVTGRREVGGSSHSKGRRLAVSD